MSATIEFKTKIQKATWSDFDYITIPKLTKSHCNMSEFRQHKKYGSYANSNMFEGMLARIKRELLGDSNMLRLDQLPNNVAINTNGFFATITIKID
jgi:hypothetical protein